MPFYADSATDPKRSFRYIFYMQGTDNAAALQPYTVSQVKKPTFSMEGGPEIKYIQHTFKYPGRVRWDNVGVTVVDPGRSEDAGQTLFNVLARSGYSLPVDSPATPGTLINSSISKFKAQEALGTPRLTQIDANGAIIEEWTLHNAYINQVDFGQLSYDDDSIVTISLDITYDYASLNRTGVAREIGIRVS
tara:strand:- start:364 stop:936 length:573 start_codon:yes stop_codon:yes gene_type:complete